MNELTQASPTHIAPFAPQEFRATQAKLDALIAYATEVKDWPLLDEAIDAKLDQQGRVVAWWGETVRSAGNPSISQKRGKLAMRDAEDQTGLRNQQISRWGKSLEQPDQYREKLRLAAYRKAGLEPEENKDLHEYQDDVGKLMRDDGIGFIEAVERLAKERGLQ